MKRWAVGSSVFACALAMSLSNAGATPSLELSGYQKSKNGFVVLLTTADPASFWNALSYLEAHGGNSKVQEAIQFVYPEQLALGLEGVRNKGVPSASSAWTGTIALGPGSLLFKELAGDTSWAAAAHVGNPVAGIVQESHPASVPGPLAGAGLFGLLTGALGTLGLFRGGPRSAGKERRSGG